MSTVKDLIDQAVDRLGDDLEKLSLTIHDTPELADPALLAKATQEFKGDRS